MKLLTYAAFTALVGTQTLTSAVALPTERVTAETGFAERQAPPPQALQVVGNASYLFGWELAGALQTPAKLKPVCADISTLGHGRWAQVGLIPADVQEPICNVSNTGTDNVLPQDDVYITNVFITQVLNAFTPGDKAPFEYLCYNFRYRPLDALDITAENVFDAVCAQVGKKRPPKPAQILAQPNLKAVQAYHNIASIVYAIELASGAATAAQLKDLCTNFATYDASKGTATLNSTQIRKTLCGFTQPLAIADASAMIKKYSTQGFVTQIENASGGVPGYLQYLCDHLDSTSLAYLGLDQDFVKTQICNDAKSDRRFDADLDSEVSVSARDTIESRGLSWGPGKTGSSYTGDLTHFVPGLGACGWHSGEHDGIVALSKHLFDQYTPNGNPNKNPLCGQYVGIWGADSKAHTAKIVDRCEDCAFSDLDLPLEYFNKITNNADGRKHGMFWWFCKTEHDC